MIFPTLVPTLMEEGVSQDSMQLFEYAIVFVTYFGLALIATFFNVCVVYTTKVRFEGGNATFGESLNFAASRIGVIVQWSLLSATVGLLLRVLHNIASRFGKVGQLISNIVIGLLGMTWSILSIFVIPTLVYEGVGPVEAVKRSAGVIKKTWGESLIKSIGLGIIQFLTLFLVLVSCAGLTYLLIAAFGTPGLFAGIAIGAALLLLTGLIFTVANTIFNTALYVYANQKTIASGFSEDVIRGAFRQK